MKRRILIATIVGAMAVGSAVALADTVVEDDAPTPALQTQTRLQQQLRIHEPGEMGSADAVQTQTRTRQQLQVQDPELMAEDAPKSDEAPKVREQVRVQVRVEEGTQTQDGTMTNTRTKVRTQVQDPAFGFDAVYSF